MKNPLHIQAKRRPPIPTRTRPLPVTITLRPEIPNVINEVDRIILSGDLGKMEILDELSGIASTKYRPG